MRALIVSGDGFEDRELQVPLDALQENGMAVDVATPQGATIHGKHGATVPADVAVEAVAPASYDLLLLPGGRAPAELRKNPSVLAIARDFFAADKPVAALCHGPQILISADLLRGRRVTAYSSVAPELEEAGADYVDEEVVVDGNLITSRKPSDLPAFLHAIREKMKPATQLAQD